MVALLKLALLFLQLATFTQSNASSLEMVRDFIKDSLYCDNDVTCSDLDAVQLTSKECDCRGGTFMKVGEAYKCVKDPNSVSSGTYSLLIPHKLSENTLYIDIS